MCVGGAETRSRRVRRGPSLNAARGPLLKPVLMPPPPPPPVVWLCMFNASAPSLWLRLTSAGWRPRPASFQPPPPAHTSSRCVGGPGRPSGALCYSASRVKQLNLKQEAAGGGILTSSEPPSQYGCRMSTTNTEPVVLGYFLNFSLLFSLMDKSPVHRLHGLIVVYLFKLNIKKERK